jgi:hypothetical protein
MKTSKVVALICCFLAAVQIASADAAPRAVPPQPDPTMPIVLAGVCLSLAIVFFGLWFVNLHKAAKAKMAQSGPGSSPVGSRSN